MITFTNVVDIGRDAGVVYAYLLDMERIPDWNWAIRDSEKITPGPIGVGTRYRLSRSSPRPAIEILEVTGLWPGRRVDVAGRLGPFAARLSYELAPTAGGTRVANAVELEPPVPLGPAGRLLAGRIRGSVADNLRVLKARLET